MLLLRGLLLLLQSLEVPRGTDRLFGGTFLLSTGVYPRAHAKRSKRGESLTQILTAPEIDFDLWPMELLHEAHRAYMRRYIKERRGDQTKKWHDEAIKVLGGRCVVCGATDNLWVCKKTFDAQNKRSLPKYRHAAKNPDLYYLSCSRHPFNTRTTMEALPCRVCGAPLQGGECPQGHHPYCATCGGPLGTMSDGAVVCLERACVVC